MFNRKPEPRKTATEAILDFVWKIVTAPFRLIGWVIAIVWIIWSSVSNFTNLSNIEESDS
jgi:hypothetical protein